MLDRVALVICKKLVDLVGQPSKGIQAISPDSRRVHAVIIEYSHAIEGGYVGSRINLGFSLRYNVRRVTSDERRRIWSVLTKPSQ